MTSAGSTLVMGLGNRVMADDAAGLFSLERFRETFEGGEDLAFLEGGTLGLELLVYMEGYDNVLILDCLVGVGAPGDVVTVEGEKVHTAFERSLSPHQMGIRDLVSVLDLMDRMPRHLAIVGIVGSEIDVGLELTPPVAQALPEAVSKAGEVLESWGVALTRRRC